MCIQEWTNPYNSFNSMKGLLYRAQMEAIIKGKFLPPVEASIDPIFQCNARCIWCNSAQLLNNSYPDYGIKISTRHLLDICIFLAKWGVKGSCFAGGGEPLLHDGMEAAYYTCYKNGLETATLTNGTLFNEKTIIAVAKCSRWVGVSIDSASPKTYSKLKNLPLATFDKVTENLRKLVFYKRKFKTKLSIAYKFLLHPLNYKEILKAAALAKSIGVDDFHVRPPSTKNVYIFKKEIDFSPYLDEINKQISLMFKLEDKNFHVYGVRHKFSPNLTKKVGFKCCLATPLLINIGADGFVYLCVDRIGDAKQRICSYKNLNDIKRFWGSESHLNIIKTVDPRKCPRCTFGPYNEIIEKVIIEDRMCKNFP